MRAIFILSALFSCSSLYAQDTTPTSTPAPTITVPDSLQNTARGVQNGPSFDMDKKERDPLLTVGAEYVKASSDKAAYGRILVDATILNTEFTGYPIRFDFFVNRKLIESQVRSKQLPGPIGIEVPSTVASVPFNYTVVATLLHPNRSFTSVIEGAVFTSTLAGTTYSCELTLPTTDAPYTASVSLGQVADNEITLSFTSETLLDSSETAPKVTVTANLTVSGDTATGNVVTDLEDGETTSNSVTGTATHNGDALSGFSVSAEDGTALDCSS